MKNIKKIELHVHLDGSVKIDTISKLSNMSYDEVKTKMQVDKSCNSLKDYLEKFDLPLKYMQTRENLKEITKELVDDLVKDNVIYVEIRFAPILHTKEGLSLEDVVDAVISGADHSKIEVNLILCMMRGDTFNNNYQVINLADKYLNRGVCAIDLAGNEKEYPNYLYKDLFMIAKEKNIPFTIHSGEADGKDSVIEALKFNPKRLGHGINLEGDLKLIEEIKKKDILLEICPTSNVQTKAIDSITNHPIYKYYKFGIPISINTDNRTVSNITLTSEYNMLKEVFPFTKEDFIKINKIALEHSFASKEIKDKLMLQLDQS